MELDGYVLYWILSYPMQCSGAKVKNSTTVNLIEKKRLIQLGMDRSLFLFVRLGAPRVQHWVQHSEQKM